jgi:hypothetical protein
MLVPGGYNYVGPEGAVGGGRVGQIGRREVGLDIGGVGKGGSQGFNAEDGVHHGVHPVACNGGSMSETVEEFQKKGGRVGISKGCRGTASYRAASYRAASYR